jgi:NAD(P)H dehydrogenase (quinone)
VHNLIVFAHPNPKSFCKAITDTVERTSREQGADVRVRDLYKAGFDPILKPADFETFKNGTVPEDIAAEQEHIRWADIITFVYPVWWASCPAMLKGYIDRVFSSGFAYEYQDDGPRGLLKGKKAMLFSTTGSSSEDYAASGIQDAMKTIADQGILAFTGIEVLRHTFFGAVPFVSDEERKKYLGVVERVVKDCLEAHMQVTV